MSTCSLVAQRLRARVRRLVRLVPRVRPGRIWERRARRRRLRAHLELRALRHRIRSQRVSAVGLWGSPSESATPSVWDLQAHVRYIVHRLPLQLDLFGTTPPQDCSINEANLERIRRALRDDNPVGT